MTPYLNQQATLSIWSVEKKNPYWCNIRQHLVYMNTVLWKLVMQVLGTRQSVFSVDKYLLPPAHPLYTSTQTDKDTHLSWAHKQEVHPMFWLNWQHKHIYKHTHTHTHTHTRDVRLIWAEGEIRGMLLMVSLLLLHFLWRIFRNNFSWFTPISFQQHPKV